MKKVLKLSSLAIVLMALLTLTACAPKADKAKEKISSDKLTYSNTLQITTDNDFQNTIHYEYYNSKR